MTTDLNNVDTAKGIAENILCDIDEWAVKNYNDGHRNHLGASLIGRKCSRFLWFTFRWCKAEDFKGRILRLFNRGHREEERFIEYLEGIGCKVWYENREGFVHDLTTDAYLILEPGVKPHSNQLPIGEDHPDYDFHVKRAKADGLKFPQFRISDCKGHFGGSLDGIALLPEKYGIKEPILLEFKTQGTGSNFNKLKKDGMSVTKYEHFCQTSVYGKKMNFSHCLYMAVNKNDDDIHCEIVSLSHNTGDQMIEKAGRIIFATEPPARLSDNPTHFECTYCHFKDICHFGKETEHNCRSCFHAKPIENKEWRCDFYGQIIPKEFIAKGCDNWETVVQ